MDMKNKEAEIMAAKDAQDKLMGRIKTMESKLLCGGKNIIDHTNEQQRALEQRTQELLEQKVMLIACGYFEFILGRKFFYCKRFFFAITDVYSVIMRSYFYVINRKCVHYITEKRERNAAATGKGRGILLRNCLHLFFAPARGGSKDTKIEKAFCQIAISEAGDGRPA